DAAQEQETAAEPTTDAPSTSIRPTWAAPPTSIPESGTARTLSAGGPVSAGATSRTGATSRSALDPDRGTPPVSGAESQEVLRPPDNSHVLVASAVAILATLSSIALGAWFIRRLSRARFQPQLSLLPTNSPDQPSS